MQPGPVITMFEYKPAPGIKVSKVMALGNDIAVALGPDNQSYTATATPVAGAGQADDTRCTGFSISDTGYRDSTGPGGRDFCWR